MWCAPHPACGVKQNRRIDVEATLRAGHYLRSRQSVRGNGRTEAEPKQIDPETLSLRLRAVSGVQVPWKSKAAGQPEAMVEGKRNRSKAT